MVGETGFAILSRFVPNLKIVSIKKWQFGNPSTLPAFWGPLNQHFAAARGAESHISISLEWVEVFP